MRTILAVLLFCAGALAQTAKFPAEVATNTQLTVVKNRVDTNLLSAATATDTTLAVKSSTGIVPNMLLNIDSEIVFVCGVAGNLVSVGVASCPNVDGRAFDGTTAGTHSANARVAGFIDAWHHNAVTAEIKAIENALGANLSNVPQAPMLVSTAYNFTPQPANGISLIAGANAITMTPVPQGVNGTDANHYLYVSGGTGTAEACLITGGSGTSGSASGQIIITCANPHTGAWTIKSATAGIQEATSAAAPAGGGEIYIPAGSHQAYATVTVPNGVNLNYRGAGAGAAAIYLNFDGDLFYANGNACLASWQEFYVIGTGAHASGYAIHIKDNTAGEPYIRRVLIVNTYGGVWVDNSDYVTIDGCRYWQFVYTVQAEAAFRFTGTSSDNKISNCHALGADNTNAKILKYGFRLEGVDGLQVANGFARADTGISLHAADGKQVTGVYFDNMIVDTCRTFAFFMDGAGTPAAFGDIRVANSHLQGNVVNTHAIYGGGVQIAWATPTFAGGVQFENNIIANMQGHGVVVFSVPDFQFVGNTVRNNGKGGGGVITNGSGLYLSAVDKALVEANNFSDNQATATQKYGIALGGNPTGGSITRNLFHSVDVAPGQTPFLNDTFTAGANLDISGNVGVDDVVATAASGASVALPFNPTVKITGITQITTLTGGWKGRKVRLIFTDAAPGGVGTGGNIARTQAAAQNQAIDLVFDGTKWY